MRILPLLALLVLAAAPVAAQGIVVPVRCHAECSTQVRLPGTLPADEVRVWANLARGQATTYVNHHFRNGTAETVDAALVLPLPADAVLGSVYVSDGALPAHLRNNTLQYGDWSGPGESGPLLEQLARERPEAGLRAYAGIPVLQVPIRAIPPGGVRYVQVSYTQQLRVEDGAVTYRYPLSAGGAAAAAGLLSVGMEVETEYGFHDLRSPSHVVDVAWGSESARCPREMRCGYRGVTSERVKVVRMQDRPGVRRRDFVVVYTLADASNPTAFPPADP